MSIAIEVDDADIRAAFAKLVKEGENPEPYLNAIGAVLVSAIKHRFETGTAVNGTPWAPVLRGGVPLRDTGAHLMNTTSYRVEGKAVVVGVAPSWAAIHHFGGTIRAKSAPWLVFKIGNRWSRKKEVTIPARPFLGIGKDDKDAILDVLSQRFSP